MRTKRIIQANIVASLFYISNGITAQNILITLGMVLWNIIILILYNRKNLHPLVTIFGSSIVLTVWLGQPFGLLLAFIPIMLILFGGVIGFNDATTQLTKQTKISVIVYSTLMYLLKILFIGFDLQELGLLIICATIICLYTETFQLNAISIKRAFKNEKKIATRDKLTGLLTRAEMEDNINEAAKKINVFSVIMMDVDKFKTINDTYGHANGDVVLKNMAQVIKNSIRDEDKAFRYGGDEFMILCPSTKGIEAQEIAERIRKSFENKKYHLDEDNPDEEQTFRASFGIAEYRYGELENPIDIIKKADQALYNSKNSGRNTISLLN